MATDKDKLARLLELLKVANNDYITADDAAKLFAALSDFVRNLRTELTGQATQNKNDMSALVREALDGLDTTDRRLQALIKGAKDAAVEDLTLYKKDVAAQIAAVKELIPTIPQLPDFQAMLDAIKIPTLEDLIKDLPRLAPAVRDALELLQDEERLDASAIKNLPQAIQQTVVNQAAHTALWALMDVDVAGIIAGQSLQWDGIKWIAYTPAGGGGTPVWAEDLTPQGPGTAYTLAHTPIAGSVRLFRGGAYQSVAAGDYSIAGASITLGTTTQSGEVLVADYSY